MNAVVTDMPPYRPNVGIALFSRLGLVLVAKRLADDGPETLSPGCEWQMPQGGIDCAEDPERAAFRELAEETGVRSAIVLGAHPDWLTYDFPPYFGPPHRLSRFRGQRQRWYALRFTGEDDEIDVSANNTHAAPEFSEWRWAPLDAIEGLVVPYKRAIYREVATAFRAFAAAE